MMRTVLVLGTLAAAAADDQAKCALDGASSVNGMAQAAINIWAATQRCGNDKFSQVKCSVDITWAIKSVNDVANIIVGAVKDCGGVDEANAECGIAVGALTDAVAGLATSSAGIADSCPTAITGPNPANPGIGQATDLGLCVIDATGATKSLFSASAKLSKTTGLCDNGGGTKCEHNVLNVVSAVADLGASLAASVNDCSATTGKGNAKAACASTIMALVSSFHTVADASVTIAKKCHVSESRLYLASGSKPIPAASNSSLLMGAAAIMSVSLVLSFAAGSRFTKARQQAPARDYAMQQLSESEQQATQEPFMTTGIESL